jgi:pimeloyl-ACP methyl ester carboxylesterase
LRFLIGDLRFDSYSRRKWRRRAIIALVILVGGWLGSSLLVTWGLTRRPRAVFAEPVPAGAPALLREIRLSTRDGESLGGWFVPPASDHAVFLLLHGVGDCRSTFRGMIGALSSRGYGAVALSFRAHGDSTGSSTDFGFSSREDVISGVSFIEQHAPGARIVVCGISMGGAAATYAAKELGERVSAYVLESVYKDLKTATWNRLELALPPVADATAYAGLLVWSRVFLPYSIERYSPIEHLRDIPADTPIYFIGADGDGYARASETDEMFATVSSHAELTRFHSPRHENLYRDNAESYLKILARAATPR